VDEGTRFLDCRWRFRVGRTMTVGIDPHQLKHLDQGFDALIAPRPRSSSFHLLLWLRRMPMTPPRVAWELFCFDDGRENRLDRLDRVIPGI
jgi:hypothetical protein